MARPLPKTNAPALTKKRNSAPIVPSAADPYAPVVSVLRLGIRNEADAARLSLAQVRHGFGDLSDFLLCRLCK